MARTVHVHPRAHVNDGVWLFRVEVHDNGVTSTFEMTRPTTIVGNTVSPKLSLDLSIGDADTPADVFAAFTVDDVVPGGRVGTVWSEYVARLESAIGPPVGRSRWSNLTPQQTAQTRQDAIRAFTTRGWTVVSFHQHQGDGSVLEG